MSGKSVRAWIGNWGMIAKVFVPAVVVVCATTSVIVYTTWRNARAQAINLSVNNAENTIQQYKALRAYYTNHVVQKVKGKTDLRVSHDHKEKDDTIPLPATVIHDLGEEFSRKDGGVQLRLYSAHPFPNRRDRRPDDFATAAMAHFRDNPNGGTFTRVERVNGEETVRVAVADYMVSQSCVDCHNRHPASSKKDWAVGDVRGVLEMDIPIEHPLQEVARHQQLVTGVAVAGAVVLLCVIALNLWLVRRRLGKAVAVLNAASTGDLSRKLEVNSRDEVGRMGLALNAMIGAMALDREEKQRAAQAAQEQAEQRRQQEKELAEEQRRRAEQRAEEQSAQAERQRREGEELRKKVDAITATVGALAAGDFTQQVPDLGDDVVGRMGAALNRAVSAVREALEGVRSVSEQLADASGQLASASEEIAGGAQEQASSLEETASTLEEITATVKQNSDSAQQARQLASGSRDVAEKGGQVVGAAVEAMGEINHASKKIADIITAIDEIAFQTNLLALNAAVEAARAGEQGRGFAVVAAEVRNLAQRSATAAKEIKALIQDSVKKVDAGSELVNRSGSTLQEIVTSVKRVTDIVAEIAAASREQSTGIDQVNKAVTQMDAVTQRNASQTEEMSATAQNLTEQAAQLAELVGRFKLGGRDGDRAPRPAHKAAPAHKTATRTRAAVVSRDAGARAGRAPARGGDGFTEF
jgi:methyl-accepting chemotaxis protein